MMPNQIFEELLDYENQINASNEKRYHLGQCDDRGFFLVEVIKMGENKIIVEGLNGEQMLYWLKRNTSLTLKSSVNKTNTQSVENV